MGKASSRRTNKQTKTKPRTDRDKRGIDRQREGEKKKERETRREKRRQTKTEMWGGRGGPGGRRGAINGLHHLVVFQVWSQPKEVGGRKVSLRVLPTNDGYFVILCCAPTQRKSRRLNRNSGVCLTSRSNRATFASNTKRITSCAPTPYSRQPTFDISKVVRTRRTGRASQLTE